MKDFQYFGLFLDTNTKNHLMDILTDNIDFNISLGTADRIFIDHCTLLHKSQLQGQSKLYSYLESRLNKTIRIKLIAVGTSDKAMAFKVKLPVPCMCVNDIPHITIATFKGGKPVDSNNISHWIPIKPIKILSVLDQK